jgi:gliding motility-associated protein GldC
LHPQLLSQIMNQSTIKIDVLLDPNKIPEQISWNATDSQADMAQKAKAMCLAFWDGADKTALRIDLWTKDMMMDEMADFYYQIFITMADTFKRATHQDELADEMKKFAREFFEKFKAIQLKENT